MIKGVLLDLAGVVFQGDLALPGAIESIERLKSEGLAIRFITNVTRQSRRALRALDMLRRPQGVSNEELQKDFGWDGSPLFARNVERTLGDYEIHVCPWCAHTNSPVTRDLADNTINGGKMLQCGGRFASCPIGYTGPA